MNITTKGAPLAPKVLLYSTPGAGKSTLAARLPDILFLDIEGGLSFIDGVARNATKYTKLTEFCRDLLELVKTSGDAKFPYKYIAIDTVDWLSRLIVQQVAENTSGKNLLELFNDQKNTLNRAGGGYGNGKQMMENYVRNIILPALTKLNDNGVGIVLIAHAEVKSVLESDGTSIDKVTPKIDPNTMNVYTEWVDNLFYLQKHDDGKRELILEGSETVLAKNRMGLTGSVPVDGLDFHKLITGQTATGAEKQ